MAIAVFGTNQYIDLINRLALVGITGPAATTLAGTLDADAVERISDADLATMVGGIPPFIVVD